MNIRGATVRNVLAQFIVAAALLCSGCGKTYQVNVSGLSTGTLSSRQSYVLLPAQQDTDVEDLQFKEFVGYLEKALLRKNLTRANSAAEADVAIFLGYGIGKPQEHLYSYSLPNWGQTGVSSAYTTGSINTYGNRSTFSGTTTFTPTYGINGYSTHVGSYTTHTRFMFADAIDLRSYRQSRQIQKLWSTTATSTGSSGDLREIFPALVVAAEPSLGVNTGQQVAVEVSEGSQRLNEIRAKAADGR